MEAKGKTEVCEERELRVRSDLPGGLEPSAPKACFPAWLRPRGQDKICEEPKFQPSRSPATEASLTYKAEGVASWKYVVSHRGSRSEAKFKCLICDLLEVKIN